MNRYKITVNYGKYLGSREALLYRKRKLTIFGKVLFTWWEQIDQYRSHYAYTDHQKASWQYLYNIPDKMVFDYTLKGQEI